MTLEQKVRRTPSRAPSPGARCRSSSAWNVEDGDEGQPDISGGAFLALTIFLFFFNLFCCLLN